MLDLSLLNDIQKKAVTWGWDPLLLLAGPGSGKTYTVVNRVLYLMEKKVSPSSILVITFTKDAASSMEKRFYESSNINSSPVFGTFHSVFYHILLESGHFQSYKLASMSQRKNILTHILKQYPLFQNKKDSINLLYQNELSQDVSKILEAISYYKNTNDLVRIQNKLPQSMRDNFVELFQKYQFTMRNSHFIDFDDMLYECKILFENDFNCLRYWQNRFQYIIVDEFQDTNLIQYELLRLLVTEKNGIMVVGDDDQSIYGFRGAKHDILMSFEKDFRAKRLLLDVNYRSTSAILEASLKVIKENKNRYEKLLVPALKRSNEEAVGIKSFQNRKMEYDYLLKQIKEDRYIDKYSSTAVLFRTNLQMQYLATVLKKNGIPFAMKDCSVSIYQEFFVKDIMAYFKIANGEWHQKDIVRIINRPYRGICREALAESKSFDDLEKWYYEYLTDVTKRDSVLKKIANLKEHMIRLKNMTPGLGVKYILHAMKYKEYFLLESKEHSNDQNDWMEKLEWVIQDISQYHTVQEWINAQIVYENELQLQRDNFRDINSTDKQLQLMTVHSSKGLEFECVYIPDCNEKFYPHRATDLETEEEERRLLYVGMTRAKKNLELLYLTGDTTRPRLASRFINSLILHQ